MEISQSHKINKNILELLRNFERLKQLSINLNIMIADLLLNDLKMKINSNLLLNDLKMKILSIYYEEIYLKDINLMITLFNFIEEIIFYDFANRRNYYINLLVKLMMQKRFFLSNLTKIIFQFKK